MRGTAGTVPRRVRGRLARLTPQERSKRAEHYVRTDRAGKLAERRAEKAGIIVARDLSILRRRKK